MEIHAQAGVLDVARGLVSELRGPRAALHLGPGDALEADLGLGSLERVELLLRLEQAFHVALSEDAVATARTLQDLARAVEAAHPTTPAPTPVPWAAPAVAAAPPDPVSTLVEVLSWHAQAHPEQPHLLLCGADGKPAPMSYGELWAATTELAGGLQASGVQPGQTVGLMLRTEAAFFPAFLGALLVGGVPVPIYPPFRADQVEDYVRRQVLILRNAQARCLVTFPEAERVARWLRLQLPHLAEVTTAESLRTRGARVLPVVRQPHDPALIQYTSGSTGNPKGVLLTHANLITNIRAIGAGLDIRPDDVAVSWLPLYHDMGLIGSWLTSLYFGIPLVLLSPLTFLARPVSWLRVIHAHHGTLSAAPNFAFDLCARKIADEELTGLDLGSWRVALNGSEAVLPETLERFTRRFTPYGFRARAMFPVYGLAECSVALTFPPLDRGPRVDEVDREQLQRHGHALPSRTGDVRAQRFVSCGTALPGHQVRVVDERDVPLAERREGCIQFRGPSVTQGYHRNPEATHAAFHDGWMDSGDLGYLADGELYVTGRRKDLIIKAGRNLHPQEVEEVVGGIPGIRKGCVAAFGVVDPALGTERFVVVAETSEPSAAQRQRLRDSAVQQVLRQVGVPPDVVVLVPPRTIPKTSSGKLRRRAAQEMYTAGDLTRPRRPVRVQVLRVVEHALRAWARRFLRRSLGLAYAAYAGILLLLLLPLLRGLLLVTPAGPRADHLVRRWCRLLLALAGCPIRVTGLEHLRGGGPLVLVANHVSYLDALVLLAVLPLDLRAVARGEVARWPVVGASIRRAGHLVVSADPRSRLETVAQATGALAAGSSVLLFPEGRRGPGDELLPFQLGAFRVAVDARRPVGPIWIRGTERALPLGSWCPRPASITVEVGAPLPVSGAGWPEMVRLRDEARGRIRAGLEQAGPDASAPA
ncbi:MAG: AMP-binding protein [Myxococcota bacterium]